MPSAFGATEEVVNDGQAVDTLLNAHMSGGTTMLRCARVAVLVCTLVTLDNDVGPHMPNYFASAEVIRQTADKHAAIVLDDNNAPMYPIPVVSDGTLAILVMYYAAGGPKDNRFNGPVRYAMYMNAETGQILRSFSCTPAEMGISDRSLTVPGAGADLSITWQHYVANEDRFLLLSPLVWSAYVTHDPHPSPSTVADVREYLALFLGLMSADDAPWYVQASPDFFAWLHVVAGH